MIWVLKLHGGFRLKMSLDWGNVTSDNLILIGSVEILVVDISIS